jgi:hypothetical protein
VAYREDLRSTVPDIALRPTSPEGEKALAQWPNIVHMRRRRQAAIEADLINLGRKHSEHADTFRALMAVPGGELAVVPGLLLARATGLVERPDEELIQAIEYEITKNEEKEILSFTLPSISLAHLAAPFFPTGTGAARLADPLRKIKEVQQAFLESKDFSPEAQQMIARVNQLNKEHDVDLTNDDSWDVVIKAGLPMVGHDFVGEVLLDPINLLFAVPSRLKLLTWDDELRRVGSAPTLAENLRQQKEALGSLEEFHAGIKAKPTPTITTARRAREAAEVKFKEATGIDRQLDLDIMRDISQRERIHSQMVTKSRTNLAGDLARDERMADEILGVVGSDRSPRQIDKELTRIAEGWLPNGTPDDIKMTVTAWKNDTAPIRAFREFLAADELHKASTKGLAVRSRALREAYEKTLQETDAVKAAIIDDLGKLGAEGLNPDILKEMKHLHNPRAMQKFEEGLLGLVDTKESQTIVKGILGYDPINYTRRILPDILGPFAEPSLMLGGTKVWDGIREGQRAYQQRKLGWAQRAQEEFGFLVTGNNVPPGIVPKKSSLKDLRLRLGTALSGRLVEELPDGTRRYTYQMVDNDNKIIKSVGVSLNPAEQEVFRGMRQLYDDIADIYTDAGIKGFERGRPILEYFPRIYDETIFKEGGKNLIPPELMDKIGPNVFTRHLIDRRLADAIVTEQLPDAVEGLNVYLPAAARKLDFEPALIQASKDINALSPRQQWYYKKWWLPLLKGRKPISDQVVDQMYNGALDAARKMGWKIPRKWDNSATKMSIATSRAIYRAYIGGMFSTGFYNLLQNVNTSARFGVRPYMRGLAFWASPEGQKMAKEARLTDDFVAIMERADPALRKFGFNSWDDLILGHMHLVENVNRGIAFGTGIDYAASKMGLKINSAQDFMNLPEKTRLQLIKRGIEAAETTQFIYGVGFGQAPIWSNVAGRNVAALATFFPKQTRFMIGAIKDDPTFLPRFVAMSGFISRLNREILGISLDNGVGFGFIPEDIGPLPIAGPMANLMINTTALMMERDNPSEKKRLFNEVMSQMSAIVTGGAAGKIPPAMFAAIPRDIAGKLPVGPEIERDLGTRLGTRIQRFMRSIKTGQITGANAELIRPQTKTEAVAELLGLIPEEARQQRQAISNFLEQEAHINFETIEMIKNVVALEKMGDEQAAGRLLENAPENVMILYGLLTRPEMFMGVLQSRMLATEARPELRLLLQRPESMLTPAGSQLLQQVQEEEQR